MRKGRWWMLAGAVAAGWVFLLAAFFVFASTRPHYAVSIGQPIRQDDFLYTVVGVMKTRSLGTDAHKAFAHGTFYVATVEVANRALRVDYRWDPSIVYVVDAAGKRYGLSLDGQRALDAAEPVGLVVAPGAVARFHVAFDLPDGVERPALAFSNGILMGDVFNGAAYMQARVPLD